MHVYISIQAAQSSSRIDSDVDLDEALKRSLQTAEDDDDDDDLNKAIALSLENKDDGSDDDDDDDHDDDEEDKMIQKTMRDQFIEVNGDKDNDDDKGNDGDDDEGDWSDCVSEGKEGDKESIPSLESNSDDDSSKGITI